MSTNSTIEWTDATWNPVTGCDEISPGCARCYAKTFAERFRGVEGHPYEQGFDLKLWPERLAIPYSWKKPQKVFVNSMSDLFHEGVHFEFIFDVLNVCESLPQHTFQILTKRAERMRTVFNEWLFNRNIPPPPNIWLGVSAENQAYAERRIPYLLSTPASIRFVSAEPLLDAIDFRHIRLPGPGKKAPLLNALRGEVYHENGVTEDAKLDWVIIGGESGPKARPFYLDHARQIIEQCRLTAVSRPYVFVKQLGRFPIDVGLIGGERTRYPLKLKSRKGGNPDEWPGDLRIREFPQ